MTGLHSPALHRQTTPKSHHLARIMLAAVLWILTACSPAAPQATATPPQPTPTNPPTALPSATPTPMPDLPAGPFTWQGSERPLLLVHFMPWYQAPPTSGMWGYHWTMNYFTPKKQEDGSWTSLASHFVPLTGPYDSADPKILEYQVLLMKLSGIDGVIVDWYGIENFWDYGLLNRATGRLFEAIEKAGLKFAICYEDQTLKHMIDNHHLKKEEDQAHLQQVMAYMQENWFGSEAYLKQDGKPLLFTFGPQYFKSGDAWVKAFETLDTQPVFVTLDNPLVPGSVAAYPWPPMWASKSGVLSHDVLKSYLDDFYDKAERWPYKVGGAFPGFKDIYKEAKVSQGYGYLDALDGATFRYTLQTALDQPLDAIQIVTWNDYGEGTNIEPTLEYGYKYLEMMQEVRSVTDPDFHFTPEDLRLPFRLYQLRAQNVTDLDLNARLDAVFEAVLSGDLAKANQILDQETAR